MIARLWQGLKSHPVELLVLLHAMVVAMLDGNAVWQRPASYAAFAAVAALCLSFHRSKRWVSVVYWAVIPIYALTALFPVEWHKMPEYWMLTALLPAVYLLARGYRDFNARFFSMVRSMMVAGGIGMLTFVLLLLIDASIETLFSLSWYRTEGYIAAFCFVLLTPMLFIGMESGTEKLEASRLEEMLVNWVLTIALLIYNVVLYAYLAMIVIRWDLPKGSVATMVSVFIGVAVVVRWLRPMLRKQPMGWYFRWFGLIALPLVVLFWVATGYRISQYGFTIDRCILVATGVLMTAFAILSLFKTSRGGYWFLAGYVVVGLLLAVGGPLSARQVSLRSQTKVVRQYAEKLGILADDGTLRFGPRDENDRASRKEHRVAYQAMKYIESDLADSAAVQQRFGVTKEEYIDHLTKKTADYVTASPYSLEYYDDNFDESQDGKVDLIRVYSNEGGIVINPDDYNLLMFNTDFSDGKIILPDTVLDADSVLAVQLAEIGCTLQSNLDWKRINPNRERLCSYRSSDGKIFIHFDDYYIDCDDDGNHLRHGRINFALIKSDNPIKY